MNTERHLHWSVRLVLLVALLASAAILPASTQAQDGASAPLVAADANGVVLQWNPAAAGLTAASAADALPAVPYNGYNLPMHVLTVALPEGAVPEIQIEQLDATDLPGGIAPAAPLLPPALDWTPDPNVTYADAPSLPSAPVFVLREGRLHGQRLVVFAFSPIYRQGETARLTTVLQARLPQATPVSGDLQAAAAAGALGPASVEASTTIPVNELARLNSNKIYKIVVSQPGIQQVPYSAIGLQGKPQAPPLLTFDGQVVAVELETNELRFYAPAEYDRWNATSVYWLNAGDFDAGAAMGEPTPAFPGLARHAFARGEWVQNKTYESVYPGADGDHWFHMDMKAAPSMLITQTAVTTVPLASVLPPTGAATVTIQSTAYVIPPMLRCQSGEKGYLLEATFLAAGGANETQVAQWNPAPSCEMQPSSAVSLTTQLAAQAMQLRFMPNPDYPTAIKLERVTWTRPVALDFAGAASVGADFWSEAGPGTYTFTNLPARWQLYDVTNPLQPKRAASGVTSTASFNQFGRAPASHYVLANLDAVQQPLVQAHTPVDFTAVKASAALYIGPALFADEMAPLLALRSQEGFNPRYIDIQQVFDVYGYGHVSPTALRNFLRAESDWQNPARRLSVVLVGDGTQDPHDYEGKANPNLVPPYLEAVDLYIKEVPCDQCYAQLNGDDPVTGDNKVDGHGNPVEWFAADIWLGRFPLRTEAEVADAVRKIVTYETGGSDMEPWRSRYMLMADNYILRLDSQANALVDPAGDFATFSDSIRALYPASASVQRIYFDPAPARQVVLQDGEPVRVGTTGYVFTEPRAEAESWRVSDPTTANATVIDALGAGAGLVTYNGHSNHFYFARTREDGGQPNWLFYTNDVGLLTNTNQPFIMLSMTCYTAQFSKPTGAGTLDELLFRRTDAGAVAVWGPTGLTIVHGHDLLQQGFMDRLWTQPAMSQRIGNLVEAGYTKLLTQGTCCQDALMTFLLFGDPLTRARVNPSEGQQLFLPHLGKQ